MPSQKVFSAARVGRENPQELTQFSPRSHPRQFMGKEKAQNKTPPRHYQRQPGLELPPLEEGKLRLYSNRFCPYAQRTRILLAHKNIEYETININLKSKPPWFFDVNPLGQVPALQLNDARVYDSKVCNEYLDDVYPKVKLVPTDPYLRARDKMLLERYTKISDSFYKWFRSGETKETSAEFKKGLEVFEKELEKRVGPYFGGEKPMNIDFCIWPHLERLQVVAKLATEFTITEEEFPRMRRWIELITTVPAVKETIFPPEIHMKRWQQMKSGIFDYDLGLEE